MSKFLHFNIYKTDGKARLGKLLTSRGEINTPAFMTVGTGATVKALTSEQILASNAEIILCNTYHLMLRPGIEIIINQGGLHKFMNWPLSILTDSGGFQIMSLSNLCKIYEEGAEFLSHIDGAKINLTPEVCVKNQVNLGVDIAMVLDDCTQYPVTYEDAAQSMQRSMRWAKRSKESWIQRPGHGLFGIVQGSVYENLRNESLDMLVDTGFDGYALGGLAVGETRKERIDVIKAITSKLPSARPRYLMGVGKPQDIVSAVLNGIDMFDCVLPTRSGRTGQAFTSRGSINIRNAAFAKDPEPLDEEIPCSASRDYSKAYIHHLIKSKEILGSVILTWHNVAYYQWLMEAIRKSIKKGNLENFASNFYRNYVIR